MRKNRRLYKLLLSVHTLILGMCMYVGMCMSKCKLVTVYPEFS